MFILCSSEHKVYSKQKQSDIQNKENQNNKSVTISSVNCHPEFVSNNERTASFAFVFLLSHYSFLIRFCPLNLLPASLQNYET